MAATSLYDFDAVSIAGKPAQFSSQRGKVLGLCELKGNIFISHCLDPF